MLRDIAITITSRRPPLVIVPVMLLFLSLTPPPTTAEVWTIKHFEVYSGPPQDWETAENVKADLSLVDEVPGGIKTVVQEYLHKVAVEYERLGFRPPRLAPVVTREDGVQAYRVYFFDYPDSENPAKQPATQVLTDKFTNKKTCELVDKPYLAVDLSRAVKHGKLVGKGYSEGLEHFGHELFHAVQMAYPLFQENCNLGDWIVEGSAEAMGIDVLYKLTGLEPPRTKPTKRWGGRNYSSSLRVKDDPPGARAQDAYGTQSLWRYIAEYVALSNSVLSNQAPGVSPTTPDYSYLHRFFSQHLTGSPSSRSELHWLDKAIETELGYDLARVFGQFVPTLVDYVPESARFDLNGRSPQESSDKWRRYLFGGCEVVEIEQGYGAARLPVALAKGGARCIDVRAVGPPGMGTVSIQTQLKLLTHIEQLRIGALGGELVSIAATPSKSANVSPFPAEWKFPIVFGAPNIFIFTNLSPKAATTEKIEPLFEFSIPSWSANVNGGDGSAKNAQRETTQPKTKKDVAKRARAGFCNPTKRSGGSVKAGRSSGGSDVSCSAQGQADNRCGAQITITLMASADILGDVDLTTGAGGALKTREGMAEGFFDMSTEEQMAQSQAYMKELMGTAGNMISITVPLVDYGHAGTFPNGHITVMMGEGRIGESVEKRGTGYQTVFVPAGTVTFAEYTPLMLRGTFSGALLDLASVTQAPGGSVHVNSAGSVKGSFVIPAPWRGDADYRHEAEGDLDTAMMDEIRQDLVGMVMMMSEDFREEAIIGKAGDSFCNMGFTETQLERMGLAKECEAINAKGTGSVPTECTCLCEEMEKEQGTSRCQEQCRVTWSQCSVVSPSTTATDEELEAIRSVFREYGYPEDLIEQYVEMLRVAPPEARQALLEQVKPQ